MTVRLLKAPLCAFAFALLALPIRAAPGDLYFSDTGDKHGVFRIAADGRISAIFDAVQPAGIAFDKAGDLYVAVHDDGAVWKVTINGERLRIAAGFQAPSAIAIDSFGNILVADSAAGTISKIDSRAKVTLFSSDLQHPNALAFDMLGRLYAADYSKTEVYRIAPNGKRTVFAAIGDEITGLAFDRDDNLFVCTGPNGGSNGYIVKITPEGELTTFAVNAGQAGLAFDNNGNLFTADYYKISKFTPDAAKSTYAAAEFAEGLAFAPPVHRLQNLSARGLVGSDDNTLIGGFIVSGTAIPNNAIVVRALGPSLPRTATLMPLADPKLELRNSSGVLIAANDNWKDSQKAQLSACGLAPSDAHEAAVFATLPAGAYTAIVRGMSGSTGTALLEAYYLH